MEELRTRLHAHRRTRHRHRRAQNRLLRSRRNLVSGGVVAEGVVDIVVEGELRIYMSDEREEVRVVRLSAWQRSGASIIERRSDKEGEMKTVTDENLPV